MDQNTTIQAKQQELERRITALLESMRIQKNRMVANAEHDFEVLDRDVSKLETVANATEDELITFLNKASADLA